MHRPARVALATTLAAVVVAVLPGVADAHDPIIVDDAQTTPEDGPLLPDGTISFALYGVVSGAGDTRGFRVRFGDGDRLMVSLLIPDLPPEQAMPDDDLPVLRVDAPDGTSRELAPDIRVAFDEPFSGTRYVRLLDLDEPAVAGEYAITVVGRAPARFTVSVGTVEQFGTPVEGVVDRSAGVAGVQAWYETPPAPATTVPASTAPATGAPTTAPPTTAPPSTTPPSTAPPTAPATAAPTSSRVPATTTATDDEDGSGPMWLVLGVVIAVAVAGALIALLPRRRRTP